MRSVQRGISTLFLVVGILGIAIAATSTYFIFYKNIDIKGKSVNSFEDCAKYYPVMESYPEQCNTPDGKHFTRELSEEEKQTLFPASTSPEKCEEIDGIISDSSTKGWKTYTGYDANLSCNTKFSVDFPEKWSRERNILYPIDGGNAEIILGASPHKWLEELEIKTKSLSKQRGNIRYSWGNPKNSDYVMGFASVSYFTPDNRLGPVITVEAKEVPLEQSQEIQTIFDQMVETISILE